MTIELVMPSMEQTGPFSFNSWLIGEGEWVTEGEPVVSVEFEKVNIEVAASASGILTTVLVSLGQTVVAGQVLAHLQDAGYESRVPATGGLVTRFLRQSSGAGVSPFKLPSYATPESAGMDLQAAIQATVVIPVGGRVLVPTGFALALPAGHEGQVRPRSGRALREGLTVLNAPGTIDADYRGEVHVILVNLGQSPITVRRGDRIAQLVIAPVVRVQAVEVSVLDITERGAGGFGHTGH